MLYVEWVAVERLRYLSNGMELSRGIQGFGMLRNVDKRLRNKYNFQCYSMLFGFWIVISVGCSTVEWLLLNGFRKGFRMCTVECVEWDFTKVFAKGCTKGCAQKAAQQKAAQ